MDPITIVIADDHALVRSGLRQLLEMEDDINVVGEAGTQTPRSRWYASADRRSCCSTSACRGRRASRRSPAS